MEFEELYFHGCPSKISEKAGWPSPTIMLNGTWRGFNPCNSSAICVHPDTAKCNTDRLCCLLQHDLSIAHAALPCIIQKGNYFENKTPKNISRLEDVTRALNKMLFWKRAKQFSSGSKIMWISPKTPIIRTLNGQFSIFRLLNRWASRFSKNSLLPENRTTLKFLALRSIFQNYSSSGDKLEKDNGSCPVEWEGPLFNHIRPQILFICFGIISLCKGWFGFGTALIILLQFPLLFIDGCHCLLL